MPNVQFERLRPDSESPSRAHAGDAGYDLRATEKIVLEAGERTLVKTGLAVAIPAGYAGLVLPRSGLAIKHGITLINAPGLIDSGYRGELMVPLVNHDRVESFTIEPGTRVAQLVIVRAEEVSFIEVASLEGSADGRGIGGFGSSGA
ncbi:MAG: dUTP diphosphatase [Rubrobacter sp.]